MKYVMLTKRSRRLTLAASGLCAPVESWDNPMLPSSDGRRTLNMPPRSIGLAWACQITLERWTDDHISLILVDMGILYRGRRISDDENLERWGVESPWVSS
jgi:hypothetical protein